MWDEWPRLADIQFKGILLRQAKENVFHSFSVTVVAS